MIFRVAIASIIIAVSTLAGLGPQNDGKTINTRIETSGKADNTNLHYKSEGEWLVGSVVTDISEMAALALNRPVPQIGIRTTELNKYEITVKPWAEGEVVDGHLGAGGCRPPG